MISALEPASSGAVESGLLILIWPVVWRTAYVREFGWEGICCFLKLYTVSLEILFFVTHL